MNPALLAALLWAGPSYMAHVAVHEGAHAWAAQSQGCHAKVSLLPSTTNGITSFGHTDMDCAPSLAILVAPVIAEALWAGVISGILLFVPKDHWLRGVLMMELVASTADLSVWCLGMLTGKAGADGTQFLRMGGTPVLPGIALSLTAGAMGVSFTRSF